MLQPSLLCEQDDRLVALYQNHSHSYKVNVTDTVAAQLDSNQTLVHPFQTCVKIFTLSLC